jgi:hypothetical protein
MEETRRLDSARVGRADQISRLTNYTDPKFMDDTRSSTRAVDRIAS